jgi:IclR family transcriptional regulator, KDG regulon repressor
MNNTLKNGFKVLEFLSSTGDSHSVKDIAETMALPNSHACRLLKTLTETGYVEQDSKTKKYSISLQVLSLSNMCLSKNLIRQKVRPFIIRLSGELQVNTYLSIPANHQPMIIDAVYANNSGNADSALTVGSINPVHTSASGKVCAAYHPEEGLQEFLSACPFDKQTANTITSRKEFKKQLEEIKSNKIALTINERGESVIAAASPVFNSNGQLVGVIGALLPTKDDYTEIEIAKYADAIRATAEAASFALGYAEYN